ncbi:MAG: NADPH-dependent FMN reductase [Rhizobiaceae bacterium]
MSQKPKIGIIIGSVRPNRFADKPTRWIEAIAKARADLDIEVIDLKDYALPFFDEPVSPAYAPSQNPVAQKWQKKVDSLDGFIFVAAEYNRAPTAVLKNALDYAYKEWNKKPAAYVGYGMLGAARAVEHLRTIAVELQMAPTRAGVHIAGQDFLGALMHGKELKDMAHLNDGADVMLDQLAWWAKALKTARDNEAVAASAQAA